MDISDSEDERNYEIENELINELFPNAKFTISIRYEELFETITDENKILIKHCNSCYCYNGTPLKNKTRQFTIKGENITLKLIFEKLIERNLELNCNHYFIEGFYKVPGKNYYEFVLGSFGIVS
jgi:hypothetical protein